jgi:diguanylate cyclase
VYLTNATGAIIAAVEGGAGASADPSAAGSAPQVRTLWIGDDTWAVTSELPVDVLGWTLVARQTALQAFRPLQAVLARTVVASAVAVALSTLLALWVAGGMSRRLQTLFDATRRVARGELDVDLPDAKVHGQFEAVFGAFNTMTRRLREARDQTEAGLRAVRDQNQAFQNQHSVLSKLSVTDGLTELHNHRYFQEQLGREIKRLARSQEGLSMLIIDIDDFKQLNDRFGHAAGDEFLKQLARILKESVRDTDLLARYGGEEFVIVATGTMLTGAIVLAEKLRTKIAETSFIVDSSMRPRRATVSIGVAEYNQSRTEFFTAADAALYRAKASGKNCVVAAGPGADEA